MDFGFSESQKILLNSAKSFLEKEAKDLARRTEKTALGYSPELWKKMAELGWMGVVFPGKYGGIDGNFLDLVLLLEEMGKALVPGPFIASIISGLSILRYGDESQKDGFLPKLIEGQLILSPALIEPHPAIGERKMEETVRLEKKNYGVSGTRIFVPFAHVADWFIYGSDTDKGKTLFLIDAKSSGVGCIPLESIAGDKLGEVNLEGVEVSEANILGEIGKGEEIIKNIEEWGALAQSSFIMGMLEQVLKMTVNHAKEREQFEKKIGSFQAIQHQCADMATDIDQVKFLTYAAAWKLGENLAAEKEISMAKAWASDASRRVCLLGIKIHGGTGVSEEHDMQLYFRRAKACELAFGDGDFHREIVAQNLGL